MAGFQWMLTTRRRRASTGLKRGGETGSGGRGLIAGSGGESHVDKDGSGVVKLMQTWSMFCGVFVLTQSSLGE